MSSRSAIEVSGKKLRTKNISKTVRKIVISPIKEMSILADDWEETLRPAQGKKLISFGQGIPYWDTPEYIKRGVKKALGELDTSKYTLEPGITELRTLIGKHLSKFRGIKNIQSKKEIMVTVGCQEAVDCAIRTIIDPGDEILLPEPAFASHIEQIIQFGGRPVFVSLKKRLPAGRQGWRLDIKECRKKITGRTKGILLSNPSNPTGMVLTRREVLNLAGLAKKHDLVIITDETYDFLTYDGARHLSPASIPSIRDRVIVCGSFSKKYALTGYRVGFAFADEGFIDHMLKVHDALAICAPAISQKAAIAALKGSQKSVKESIKKFTLNRKLMMSELDKLSEFFEYEKPMGSYYILVRVKRPKINSFKLAIKILREANVIVIPGAAFGPSGEGHLRFSFAGEPQNIRQGFSRLRTWLDDWKDSGYKL